MCIITWVGWHHCDCQNVQLCQSCSLIITPRANKTLLETNGESSIRREKCHALLKGTWQNGEGTHPVAIKLQIATESRPSARRASLMGCLMRPSNANGTLVVTLGRPGSRVCGGEYSTSAIFHSRVDITIGSRAIAVGSAGWCYCTLISAVSHLA